MKRTRAAWCRVGRGLGFGAALTALLSAGATETARAHEGTHEHEHANEGDEVEGPATVEDDDFGAESAAVDRANTEEGEGAGDVAEEPPAWATDPILPSLRLRHEMLAKAALHRVPEPDNHFGLVMAVAERTSDLPWILAIENRGDHDVRFAALPTLLTLEVTPPADEKQESTTETGAGVKTKKGREPVRCGDTPPRRLDEDETVLLPAGGQLIYPFDPRNLCEDASVLSEGSRVVVRYGFPIQMKKLWQKGKLVEVEAEQRAPFLAVDPREDDEATKDAALESLKKLETELLPLDRTYPLEAFSERVLAGAAEADAQRAEERRAAKDEAGALTAAPPPPPPLRVTLSPLGKTSDPEQGFIRVRIRNVSSESVSVYIRREHLTYRIRGPLGTSTCRMHPTNPSASSLSFSRLSPGESRSLTTRLAEACPEEAWGPPGEYVVAALFSPNQTGQRFGLNAFVGEVQSENVARLTLVGKKTSETPKMRVIASDDSGTKPSKQ